jgi:hypothetical protein
MEGRKRDVMKRVAPSSFIRSALFYQFPPEISRGASPFHPPPYLCTVLG